MPKEKKTAIQKHYMAIGKKGGAATAKKYGKDHFSNISKKRWSKNKADE